MSAGRAASPRGCCAFRLLIHEQNAIAGLTNRWLARLATQVLEAFPGSFGPAVHARTIGNPVRADIAALPPPAQRFAGREPRAAPAGIRRQPGRAALERRAAARRWRVSPPSSVRRFAIRPASAGLRRRARPTCDAQVEAEVLPFIDDMAKAYAWADLAVCRAGAMTVAELQAAGLGAIFVPLPHGHRRSSNQERRRHGGRGRGANHPGARSDCRKRLSAHHRRADRRSCATAQDGASRARRARHRCGRAPGGSVHRRGSARMTERSARDPRTQAHERSHAPHSIAFTWSASAAAAWAALPKCC